MNRIKNKETLLMISDKRIKRAKVSQRRHFISGLGIKDKTKINE
jgi:hypothetical protein